MSWWDTSGITSLASQALKNAQKKIDKVLEIDAGGSAKQKGEFNTKCVVYTAGFHSVCWLTMLPVRLSLLSVCLHKALTSV